MISVVRFVNSRFSSNSYIIYSTKSEAIWVVDPGDFGLLDAWMIENRKSSIKGVLITHAHFDHIYGVNELWKKFQSVVFYVYNEYGRTALYDDKINGSKYTDTPIVMNDKANVKLVSSEMALWQNCEIRTFYTPGHSEDSMCILLENILFTGDTLIKNYRTVTKLKGGSVEKLQSSIDVLSSLKGKGLTIYGGHEEPFELDEYDLSIANTNKM